jgi:hypothetical protein
MQFNYEVYLIILTMKTKDQTRMQAADMKFLRPV